MFPILFKRLKTEPISFSDWFRDTRRMIASMILSKDPDAGDTKKWQAGAMAVWATNNLALIGAAEGILLAWVRITLAGYMDTALATWVLAVTLFFVHFTTGTEQSEGKEPVRGDWLKSAQATLTALTSFSGIWLFPDTAAGTQIALGACVHSVLRDVFGGVIASALRAADAPPGSRQAPFFLARAGCFLMTFLVLGACQKTWAQAPDSQAALGINLTFPLNARYRLDVNEAESNRFIFSGNSRDNPDHVNYGHAESESYIYDPKFDYDLRINVRNLKNAQYSVQVVFGEARADKAEAIHDSEKLGAEVLPISDHIRERAPNATKFRVIIVVKNTQSSETPQGAQAEMDLEIMQSPQHSQSRLRFRLYFAYTVNGAVPGQDPGFTIEDLTMDRIPLDQAKGPVEMRWQAKAAFFNK